MDKDFYHYQDQHSRISINENEIQVLFQDFLDQDKNSCPFQELLHQDPSHPVQKQEPPVQVNVVYTT